MSPRSNLLLPIASLVAIAIVGVSAWYATRDTEEVEVEAQVIEAQLDVDQIRTIQSDDHVFGNPNAPIVLIVYSDFQCPFCREFHKTMHNVINLYGGDGDVAWVYRHMPLISLHPEAPMYALASECIAAEGGNQAFWDFADDLFGALEPGVVVDAQGLLELAEDVGVSRQSFASCMRSNALMDEVEEDFDEIVAAGALATPYTVVITPDDRATFEGAKPFVAIGAAIRSLVQSLHTEPLATPSVYDSFKFDFENARVMPDTPGSSTSSTATTSDS